MKTIALVAEKGAGKGLFVESIKKLFPRLRIVSIRFSDPLCDILDMLGKEKSRQNIDAMITALREAFHDEGLLNGAMRKRLQGMQADIIILDGLRKEEEVAMVREYKGILIFITARQEQRYQRRKDDPEKPDEAIINLEQFIVTDQAAPQISIRRIGETMADAVIENNGTREEFEEKIKEFCAAHGIGEN
ncbi:MAG: hypothetical protein Q8R40_07030 [bacterium]|nr:hypothetical protein [bacterium]